MIYDNGGFAMDLKFYEVNKYKMIYRLTGFEGMQLSYLQVVDILGQRQGYVEGSRYSYKDYLVVTNLDRALQFCVTSHDVYDELMVITGVHINVIGEIPYFNEVRNRFLSLNF